MNTNVLIVIDSLHNCTFSITINTNLYYNTYFIMLAVRLI